MHFGNRDFDDYTFLELHHGAYRKMMWSIHDESHPHQRHILRLHFNMNGSQHKNEHMNENVIGHLHGHPIDVVVSITFPTCAQLDGGTNSNLIQI